METPPETITATVSVAINPDLESRLARLHTDLSEKVANQAKDTERTLTPQMITIVAIGAGAIIATLKYLQTASAEIARDSIPRIIHTLCAPRIMPDQVVSPLCKPAKSPDQPELPSF